MKNIKKHFICLFIFASLGGLSMNCTNQNPDKKTQEEYTKQIIQTDKDFNILAQSQGFGNACIAYADSQVVKFTNGSYPVVGLVNLDSTYTKAADIFKTFKITWEPLKAEVSSDGEIGYSIGTSTFTYKVGDKDTTGYGIYITVWKHQPDGSYKYVMDGGNSVPGPLTQEMFLRQK